MSRKPAPTAVTPTSLIDEMMDHFQRGEASLFADLARATWGPQTRLAAITGSLNSADNERAAA